MTETYRKKLIEVALPLDAINAAAVREKAIRHGHPSTLHLWWARRPLAAARAVLFAQLVDDPSAWPERFPTEASCEFERQRLFGVIEALVKWESTNNNIVLYAAKLEIARSWARSHESERGRRVLADNVSPEEVENYVATVIPPVHDPFAGGGTIPLEAQRLGLRVIASDLNPVAVLINKALVELPPKFADRSPSNPESRKKAGMQTWVGSQGLAEDVRYYGKWMRDEAEKSIGHLYPSVTLPATQGKSKATAIAWLWARTITCPNPACRAQSPLIRSFVLASKRGKEVWVKTEVDRNTSPPEIHFFTAAAGNGDIPRPTISRNGARCLVCEAPIALEFIREEGRSGRLGNRLVAVVAQAARSRLYLPPDDVQAQAADIAAPTNILNTTLPKQALGFRVQAYGLVRHRDLFTARQLVLLATFCALVHSVRTAICDDARRAGASAEEADIYSKSVATFLALAVSRMANYASCLCFWSSHPKDELVKQVFSRQALVMAPDYAETNPFAESSGGWDGIVEYVAKAIPSINGAEPGLVLQYSAAAAPAVTDSIVCCDPPYYDNIGYADLSDFFYVWLRLALRNIYPEITSSVLTPKDEELVSEPGRFATKELAQEHFESGLTCAFESIRGESINEAPVTIFYAFKQSEKVEDDSESGAGTAVSSGWERMLAALCESRFSVVGTWPVRTELGSGLRGLRRNALASSIVLVCRKRADDAKAITRGEFRRALRKELPNALKALQQGNIAPVDVAQAAIGPGMSIFSRYAKIIDADGSAMSVRSALQFINEALDEYLTAQVGEIDADTRFALTWYDQHGFETGSYGTAELLATARAVSVAGVVESGILYASAGKVRLLKRSDLPAGWFPATDARLTLWEGTQYLIKRLEEQGEQAAAELYVQLGPAADAVRDLAYRLYSICERRGWAEDARAYNSLVVAWPELERLAATIDPGPQAQSALFE